MKPDKFKMFIICCSFLFVPFLITGCSSRLIEYSSTANNDLKVSALRTEMLIMKSDDENIRRDYFIASAVDYLQDGKKTYYLMIIPSDSSITKPTVEDLLLNYDYPYIIQAQNIKDLIANLEKCYKEWESKDINFSGSIFNFTALSTQNARIWFESTWEGNKTYETTPYIKFNYSKTQRFVVAKLALGERTEEVISTVVDGKTVKNRIFFQDIEKSWLLEESEQIKDLHNLLTKGYLDLKEKGMRDTAGRYEDKTEIIPQEVKTDIVNQEVKKDVNNEEIKKDATPVQVEKKKPKKRKKKR